MTTQAWALAKRLFPERQVVLRSGAKVRYVSLPGWTQAIVICTGLAMLCGIGGLAGAYHNLHKAIHRKEAEISEAANRAAALATLRDAVAQADAQYGRMTAQFDDVNQQLDAANGENEAMRVAIEGAEARAVALDKTRLLLEERLHNSEQALASKTGNLSDLSQQLTDSRSEVKDAEQARLALQKKLQQLQSDSASANDRTGQLKDVLAQREREMRQIAGDRDRLRAQLDQQQSVAARTPLARGYVSQLETLVASTGVDIDKLIGRFSSPAAGTGGPYVAFDPRRVASDDKERQAALRGLVEALPLGAPLDHFQVESGFGRRADPINHRSAFHSGMDLSSAYRSPVLSTAPGVVTFTGVKDDYGRVVEITHAHGIVTRYAHLHRILVAPGQKVQGHQVIAELGSTGRSTGPHVHYEVLVDGVPLDPAKFMEAGKGVTQIRGN